MVRDIRLGLQQILSKARDNRKNGVSVSFSAMEYRSVIILTVIMNACHRIDTFLSGVPSDTEVKINDSTNLNCSTSLLANQVQWRHGNNYVYTGLAILEPYNGRFSVEINALTGACNLVIRSVQPSDAGTYECTDDEGTGDRRSVQLVVLDGDPVCKSNVPSDGIIGPNSCGIEPEEVELSCSIKYHGNSLPVLQWRVRDDNHWITGGRFKVTWSNNEVTYTLTMKSSLGLRNSSFICQTTRSSDKHYSCSSDVVNILYVFSSKVAVNMTMNEQVNCFANASQSCSYKWDWFNGDDIATESYDQTLKPKKLGTHRCETTCSIRNKSCSVQSMHATVYIEEGTSGQTQMPLLVLLLVPALAAIGVIICMFCRRKRNVERRRQEEIELLNRKVLGLIATIRTKAADEMKKCICGLAIVDNELFVVSQECSEVEVYDSTSFSFSRQWTLKELISPWDIASCQRNKCLYINDGLTACMSKEIVRLDLYGKLIKKWSTKEDCGQLSVAYDSNVILIAFRQNKLNEYSPDGDFIRDIHLSSEDGFCHPWHAIKLTNGHFVVSHGTVSVGRDDGLHRVCIVDADGKLLKSFGGERGSTIEQTYAPMYLSVYGNGSVMVADYGNRRVLLLESDLKFKREILTEENGLHYPYRILLDESNGRIFVADREAKNARVLIFDLLRLMNNLTLES